MLKQVATCDHCNAEIQGEPFYVTRLGAAYSSESQIHACSLAHLGLAVAKVFGVPIDVNLVELVKESNYRLTGWQECLADLEKALSEGAVEHGKAISRIAALEAEREELLNQCINANALPLGQVAYEAWKSHPNAARAGEDRGREYPAWEGLIASEQGEWATIERAVIAGLTGPKKPTKPAIDDCEAYIEARMDYRRVVGGTADEMGKWWTNNRASFRHDERMVMANGDIVRDVEFEQ